MKKITFILCFIISGLLLSGQEFVNDKSATILSLSGDFSSFGGDIFTTNKDPFLFSFAVAANHFLKPGFFIGGEIDFSLSSDEDKNEVNSIGLGPKIGYMFGDAESHAFPYLSVGLNLYNRNINYRNSDEIDLVGTDVVLGAGLVFEIENHLGILVNGSYHLLSLKEWDTKEHFSGNYFSLSIGLTGFFYNTK